MNLVDTHKKIENMLDILIKDLCKYLNLTIIQASSIEEITVIDNETGDRYETSIAKLIMRVDDDLVFEFKKESDINVKHS